jgi:hypothetical protein
METVKKNSRKIRLEKNKSFGMKEGEEEERGLKTRFWWQRRGTGWDEEENEEGRRKRTR